MWDIKEPPSVPKRISPERYARMGRFIIACGVALFAIALAYFMHSGMRFGTALGSALPLLGIFIVMGWSMCRMGADGLGVAAGYLAACVALCGLVAAWLTGK